MRQAMLLATAVLAMSACSTGHAEDGGPSVSRNFAVGAFSKLEVAGPFDVAVTTGKQPGATAQGPKQLIDRLVVEVDGDTLKIRPERKTGLFGGTRWSGEKARVTVTVPMLRAASIAGSGTVAVDRVSTDRFEGEVAGSGRLRLPAVTVKQLDLEIAGSGDVQAVGQADSVQYAIAGSGNINADRLAAQTARAEIAGSGNIQARAARTADVEIAGSGNVTVRGGARCTISKAGSGNVSCS